MKKRRYEGKEPEIKDVWDAAYYGVITEEEMSERMEKTDRNSKMIDKIIGFVVFPIFLIWTIASVCAYVSFPSTIILVHGVLVGLAGILFSGTCLKKALLNLR